MRKNSVRVRVIFICFILLFFGCTKKKKAVTENHLFSNVDYSFAVYGQSAGSNINHSRLVKLIKKYKVNLVFHTGNVVQDSNDEQQWANFFNTITPISNLISRYYVCPGKTDKMSIEDYNLRFGNAAHLLGQNRFYYSFIFNKCLFFILNTTLTRKYLYRQQWYIVEIMKRYIKKHNGPVFVFMHRPLYSSGPLGRSKFFSRHWHIFFEHFRVNLVFSGGDKFYGRYKSSSNSSTYCLVTAGASEKFDVCGNPGNNFEQYVCRAVPHFIYVGVKKRIIGVKVIDINNNVIDHFETRVLSRWHTRKGVKGIYKRF